jgi:hypothetical protein
VHDVSDRGHPTPGTADHAVDSVSISPGLYGAATRVPNRLELMAAAVTASSWRLQARPRMRKALQVVGRTVSVSCGTAAGASDGRALSSRSGSRRRSGARAASDSIGVSSIATRPRHPPRIPLQAPGPEQLHRPKADRSPADGRDGGTTVLTKVLIPARAGDRRNQPGRTSTVTTTGQWRAGGLAWTAPSEKAELSRELLF